MDLNREEEIRKRARRIWEEEGKPDGRDTLHWAQAEQELDAAGGARGAAGNMAGTSQGASAPRGAEELKPGNEKRPK